MSRRGFAAAVSTGLAVAALVAAAAQEADVTFEAFLADLREEALARGLTPSTVERALAGLTPEPAVVSRDRTQPEQTLTLDAYLSSRLSSRLVSTARERLSRHRDVLARVDRAYGIPPHVITAVWGLESNFGQITGTHSTIRALATLAYDARRAIFRTELFHALTIIDRGDVPLEALRGSWAGAMGQPQFMPSSFLAHAVDFDEDGRTDIWASEADVFASIANYLRAAGWTPGQRWGREVALPEQAGFDDEAPLRSTGCLARRDLTTPRPLATWTALGVRLADGRPLPAATLDASLLRGERRNFLVYGNFEALLDYNCSNAYAVSVGLLADRIAG